MDGNPIEPLVADEPVHARIERLVEEEHVLLAREEGGAATDADRARLDEIRVQLDREWDTPAPAARRAGRRPRPGRGVATRRPHGRGVRAVAARARRDAAARLRAALEADGLGDPLDPSRSRRNCSMARCGGCGPDAVRSP